MVDIEKLRIYQTISALIAEVGSPETVVVIEEGTARQYSFPQLSDEGTLVVVERSNSTLEFLWYTNPEGSTQETPV